MSRRALDRAADRAGLRRRAGRAARRPRACSARALDRAARAALLAGMARRPQDYVGQEVVRLSTMPAVAGGTLVAAAVHPARVRRARRRAASWTVMPGGFARLGERCRRARRGDGRGRLLGRRLHRRRDRRSQPVSLLPANVAIRRNPGTLPSRAADNLFWLGRYLERGEATLRLVRAALGGTIDAVGGAALVPATLDAADRAADLERRAPATDDEDEEDAHARPTCATLAIAALDGDGGGQRARRCSARSTPIAEGTRDRLSADVWRLIDAAPPARARRRCRRPARARDGAARALLGAGRARRREYGAHRRLALPRSRPADRAGGAGLPPAARVRRRRGRAPTT